VNTVRLRIYVAFVSALAAAALWSGDWTGVGNDPTALRNCVAAALSLGVLAELFALRVRVGTTTSSVAFVPFLATILLVGPSWAMIVAGATYLVAETLIRHKPMIKAIHNTAKEILSVGMAGKAYVVLGGVPSLIHFDLAILAFGAMVLVYFLLSTGATTLAIAVSTKSGVAETWHQVVGSSLLYDAFSSSLAVLLAFLYVQFELPGLLLVIVPLFFVRHTYNVNLQLEQVNRDLLELMVKAIEARDPYTSGHSLRVSAYARTIAREAGLPSKQVELVEAAALLHDVGKIYQEFAPILRKEGRLTPEEFALMKTHPVRSFELVRTISSFRGAVEQAVRHHHEDFDGTGYPDGVGGETIPLGARIIRIADTTDAMTTDRPYRAAMSYEKVVSELEKYSAVQFDPKLVELFKKSSSLRALINSSSTRTAFESRVMSHAPELLVG
jgi:putative nucleotidyltransferase with HDIG domain